MKKIIGMLCVAIATIAMFFTPKPSINSELAGVISLNVIEANADNPSCEDDPGDKCCVYGTVIKDCDESQTNGCKDGSS
jgi:hypothetical protein